MSTSSSVNIMAMRRTRHAQMPKRENAQNSSVFPFYVLHNFGIKCLEKIKYLVLQIPEHYRQVCSIIQWHESMDNEDAG